MATMDLDNEGEEPLVPVHPFNEPGEDIVLYKGPVADVDGRELHGRVLLRCGSRLDVVWQLDDAAPARWALKALTEPEIRLRVRQPSGVFEVAGLRSNPVEGSVDGQSLGSEEALLQRVQLHWMNLPSIHSPTVLRQGEGEDSSWWTGRWRFTLGPWQLTLDRREDHNRVWDILGSERNFVMTHVMEASRVDGQAFTAKSLKPLQLALHFGMSFALGRWVGPAAPVGIDSTGSIAWRHWANVFCDPGRNGSLAWLHYTHTHDLHELLSRAYAAFDDPDRSPTTRFLLSMATETNHAGRVEPRTMTAFSALELLSWVVLKQTNGLSNAQYKSLGTQGRIKQLLRAASVDIAIDTTRQPSLAQFAMTESATTTPLDGPAALTRVRNRLVHPNSPQDEVYHLEGLVTNTWLLSRHYLNLLILHWLGYNGSYQSILGPGGWAGDSDPVPWAPQPASTP